MSVTVISMLVLGFVLGIKHAIETDHVAAVATIVSQQRNVWRSSLVGAVWGMGHTTSLLIAGILIFGIKIVIPERVGLGLELLVGAMLVGLGLQTLARAARGMRVHRHAHVHSGGGHTHPHLHAGSAETHEHRHIALPTRSFWVGVMHGLAGSGAVTVLVLVNIRSAALGLGYLLIFGLGSILGMLLMSAVIGIPFALTAGRSGVFHLRIQQAAGVVSIVVGTMLMREILSVMLG